MIDFSNKPELSLLAEIVSTIKAVARGELFIVGAQARDLLLHHQHGIDTGRATLDVDLAITVSDWKEFHQLRASLIATAEFVESGIPHRLKHRNFPVDIVPFGGIENADRTIAWPAGDAVMNTLGFRETLSTCVAVLLPFATEVAVASLPSQALLKLIAWSDLAPARGTKDAQDFRVLTKTYHRVVGSDRLHSQSEQIDRSDYDIEGLGARLLGFDAAREHAFIRDDVATSASSMVAGIDLMLHEEAGRTNINTLVAAMGGGLVEVNYRLASWFRDGLRTGMASAAT